VLTTLCNGMHTQRYRLEPLLQSGIPRSWRRSQAADTASPAPPSIDRAYPARSYRRGGFVDDQHR